ncbi:MAG: hypothetical protein RLY66_430 [Candidatus Parcubacteria bacterium]|jgi:S1-C subfamily serine protease
MFCTSCGNEIKENIKFCTSCGAEVQILREDQTQALNKTKKYFTKSRVVVACGIFLLIVIVGLVFFYNSKRIKPASDQTNLDIASAVVNIYCTGEKEEDTSGGSGTILTEDGLVLTNAHIIPKGAEDTSSCLVILPDPSSGAPDEIYTAYPIVIPDLSEQYDLAFVQIDDVYYDMDEGKTYGVYPKNFPAYDSNKYCRNENVKLGEPVRIYGYPAISGGYALTITDGIVSSLLAKDGLIITSAKISHGNSGGLAVDQYGCRIGIPSMVSGDDYESLGVIISNDLIYDFISELNAIIELNGS